MLKFIFGMQINIEVFYKLIISFCVYIARHAQSTQNKKFVYLCNISRKLWGMNLIVHYYNVTYAFTVNLQLPECQGTPCLQQVQYVKFKCHSIKLMKLPTVSLDYQLSFDEADFFSLQINTKVFQNLIVTIWVCVARHTQSAQITSAQYLKEKNER